MACVPLSHPWKWSTRAPYSCCPLCCGWSSFCTGNGKTGTWRSGTPMSTISFSPMRRSWWRRESLLTAGQRTAIHLCLLFFSCQIRTSTRLGENSSSHPLVCSAHRCHFFLPRVFQLMCLCSIVAWILLSDLMLNSVNVFMLQCFSSS